MIIWKEIDTVLLDMDGTLLDLHFDNYFWQEYLPKRWAEKNNLEIEAAKEVLLPIFHQSTGTLDWYCLDHWSERLDINILSLKADIKDMIIERPAAIDFLKFLVNKGKQTALVTNAHNSLIDMKFSCTGIGKYFENVFCSHDFGYPKEDVKFWESLQETYAFNPSRTLLLDDNTNVLRSAKKYGISHLLSIAQPDSSTKAVEAKDFPVVGSFLDLMV